jgi:hypothetical protein
VDRIVGHLFRRYAFAGVLITVGVVSGVVVAQRQHIADFPPRTDEAAPCLQACEARARCAPEDVARCAVMCQGRAAKDREQIREQARCVLDKPCAEQGSCGAAW